MKVRSVANGNIIDLPEDHGLVVAGIYEKVEEADAGASAEPEAEPEAESDAEPVFTPSPRLEEALVQPEAKVLTTAHLRPKQSAKQAKPRGRRK